MKIAVPAETDSGETRVAATADSIKRLIGLGAEVTVEKGAGTKAGIPDSEFANAGANVASGKDVVAGRALRHAVFGIEPRQRFFGGVERREDAVGDSDQGAGHGALTMQISAG